MSLFRNNKSAYMSRLCVLKCRKLKPIFHSYFRLQTVKMVSYQCEECGTSYPRLSQLLHHRRIENHWKKYICSLCKKVFNRKDNLHRHMQKHQNETITTAKHVQKFSLGKMHWRITYSSTITKLAGQLKGQAKTM